ARAGRAKLGLGALNERCRAADRCELERMPKVVAGLRTAIRPAECCPQLGARLRVLELRGRVCEHVNGFLEEREAFLITLDEARYAQGCSERPGSPPDARELELVRCERPSVALPAELEQRKRRLRPPGEKGRVATSECLGAATSRERVLEAAGEIAV